MFHHFFYTFSLIFINVTLVFHYCYHNLFLIFTIFSIVVVAAVAAAAVAVAVAVAVVVAAAAADGQSTFNISFDRLAVN